MDFRGVLIPYDFDQYIFAAQTAMEIPGRWRNGRLLGIWRDIRHHPERQLLQLGDGGFAAL